MKISLNNRNQYIHCLAPLMILPQAGAAALKIIQINGRSGSCEFVNLIPIIDMRKDKPYPASTS